MLFFLTRLITFIIEGSHAVVRSVPKSDFLEYARSIRGRYRGPKVDVKKALADRARRQHAKKG